MIRWVFSPLLLIFLAACGTTSIEKQTLDANEIIMSTALSEIYATATAEAERLQITAEFVDRRINAIGTQSGLLIATLEQRGIVIETTPLPMSPTPGAGATIPPTLPPLIGEQPLATENPNASPTPVLVTPYATQTPFQPPTSEIVVDTPQILRDIVLDDGVGQDDCATSPQASFTTDTQEIYIIARAVEMPDGTTVTTRWKRGDDELVVFDFTYDEVEDACIWFYADQTNFDFLPGDYTITVEINGLPFGTPVPFSIAGQ